MITDFQVLTSHDPLSRAIDRILAGAQQDFPVVDDGQIMGVLTRHDLLVGLTQRGQDTLVGDTMQREFKTVDESEMLETSFRRLQSCECHTVPVLRRGELVGLVWPSRPRRRLSLQPATAPEVSCHSGNTLSFILDAITQVGCRLRSRMAELTMLVPVEACEEADGPRRAGSGAALAGFRATAGAGRRKRSGVLGPLATSPGVRHD